MPRDLVGNPFRGQMRCDIDPDKVSAGQPNDDEDIEQIKANGRNNEQVHGGDVRCVVTQEGAPSLGGRPGSLDHVLRDAGLSDLKAEFEQLAMDAGRALDQESVMHADTKVHDWWRAEFLLALRYVAG
jgi:hypothetical protein